MQSHTRATVKWFNATKGFGFVRVSENEPDAFLHISVLQRAGYSELPEGTIILCDLGPSQKGTQVTQIFEVEGGAPEDTGMTRDGFGADTEVDGVVKFFSAEKGFGFILPDSGGKDVYVGLRTVHECGMDSLDQGQRVRMTLRMGKKGPMATSIEPL